MPVVPVWSVNTKPAQNVLLLKRAFTKTSNLSQSGSEFNLQEAFVLSGGESQMDCDKPLQRFPIQLSQGTW